MEKGIRDNKKEKGMGKVIPLLRMMTGFEQYGIRGVGYFEDVKGRSVRQAEIDDRLLESYSSGLLLLCACTCV